MFAEITLTTVEGAERKVPMLSHAAIPIRYKNLFHKDLMIEVANFLGEGGMDDSTFSTVMDMVPQLSYVMAMAAEHTDMSKLTFDGYVAWLEGFSSETFIMHSGEIINIYYGNMKGDSKPKNPKARQSAK